VRSHVTAKDQRSPYFFRAFQLESIMTLRRVLLPAFALLSLAACASPTAPAPTTRQFAPSTIQRDELLPPDSTGTGSEDRSGWPITHG
jgi:hypothetical protein